MRYVKYLGALCVLSVLSACSIFPVSPKGMDQDLASAYGVYSAVVDATATAVSVGTLSSAEGESVQEQTRSARGFLDASKAALSIGDTQGAQDNYTLAIRSLTLLQNYLNTHQPRGGGRGSGGGS